ncbi:hypothetical protein QYM36_018912 [Artemia franciscana]|uniref:BZIP domain-containing protein n=1 Tax=Artemia franciscana TaxID=6661 RepID=A0AA88KU93_ARTSF|nr:hypothetical protein QYM36_018912 [Artemia franciscana]
MHQQCQKDSFWPQSAKSNEGKRVQEPVANYGLCKRQENIKDKRSPEPSSVVNTFQDSETSDSPILDFPTMIDSHTSQKFIGHGNFFNEVHKTSRTEYALEVEKPNKLENIQALFPKIEWTRERNKEAAWTYRKRKKDYLELERQVIANIDFPAENLGAVSIREDGIDLLREGESFQTTNISGDEILKPLDLSTRSQAGGSSFSNTPTFEDDAFDISRKREPGLSFCNTRSFEEVKTGVVEPNSLSALQESTNKFRRVRSKNQGGKNVECFDRYSLKFQSNFKELEPKNVLARQEEITLKGLTKKKCRQNSDDRLSACEKVAKRKEGNRIAAKKYRMKKKMKLQELQEMVVKLETLQRGKTLQ